MTTHGVLVTVVLLALSSTSVAGVTFEQITTVDGERTTVMKVAADRGKARMEMVESPNKHVTVQTTKNEWRCQHDAAFEWAVDVITKRRTADAGGADVRGQVVRDLVELGASLAGRRCAPRSTMAPVTNGSRLGWPWACSSSATNR